MRTTAISSSGENAAGSEGVMHSFPKKRSCNRYSLGRRNISFNYPFLNKKLFLGNVYTPTHHPMVPDRFLPDEKDGISKFVSRINMRLCKSRADVWLQEHILSKRDRIDMPGSKRVIPKFDMPVLRQ
jgi:hypothetical protein